MLTQQSHNKAFKRDSCRVAFFVCSESGVRKLGLGGIHPLTRRYELKKYPVVLLYVIGKKNYGA
ncbi:TPA: hypothetical protein ACGUPD_004458 [Vibrio vulnificus]|nr:hypothetical protein [Vibrio vulnificus]